jgi:hypothetical protein
VNITASLWTFSLGQLAWIVLSVVWIRKRRDEIPLIASTLLFYVFTFRLWALLQGWTPPVSLINFGFDSIEPVGAVAVQGIALLGESVLLATYMLVQKRTALVSELVADPHLLHWLRPWVFCFVGVCIPVAIWVRTAVNSQIESGKSMGFEVSSYLSLFPLALGGVAILLAALWRAGGLITTNQKLGAALSFGAIGYLTFQPALRFQFFGWFLATMIIYFYGRSFGHHVLRVLSSLVLAVTLFVVAGALRNLDDPEYDLQQRAWERFAFAHDANMLDGFVFLRQVYPSMLNYSCGGEHLEIIQRPIPRSLWPDKPVGGYLNKLGIITAGTGFTLGISPSLFGSFYQEGGIPGVIFLSALYGFGFAMLIRFSMRVIRLTGMIIRGMTCAALVPLLRGGDLPGIYAWFGMSFWPIFLIFLLKRREFFSEPPLAPAPVLQPPLPPYHLPGPSSSPT